jgi:hypothetical protein
MIAGAALLFWSMHRVDKNRQMAAISTTVGPEMATGTAEPLQPAGEDPQSTEPETSSPFEIPQGQQNSARDPEVFVQDLDLPVRAPDRPPARETWESTPAGPARPAVKPPEPQAPGRTYATGTLRQFTSRDFKREVVEASRVHPVLFEFYSDT